MMSLSDVDVVFLNHHFVVWAGQPSLRQLFSNEDGIGFYFYMTMLSFGYEEVHQLRLKLSHDKN